jgi:S-adenosylmethionine:diacylglycerol 3-amino-3-carboxypropyl transferase
VKKGLRLASDRVTLRDLLERIVTRRIEVAHAEQIELLNVLYSMGGGFAGLGDGSRWARDKAEHSLTTAAAAFANGQYRVLLDGNAVTSLDEPLAVGENSELLLVRTVSMEGL